MQGAIYIARNGFEGLLPACSHASFPTDVNPWSSLKRSCSLHEQNNKGEWGHILDL